MEVSTKCQVDISSVWAAWGMACLKTGDFKAAKEKFHTCFKVQYMPQETLQNPMNSAENLRGFQKASVQLTAHLVFLSGLLPSTETTVLSICTDVHNKGIVTAKSGGGQQHCRLH